MTFSYVLAGSVVSDLATAEPWYRSLFGRDPDARPMAGLLEWHLDGASGVQVWQDPERAGRSSVVLGSDDLDAAVERLTAEGVAHDGPEPGGGARLLRLVDPDGNSVVLLGA